MRRRLPLGARLALAFAAPAVAAVLACGAVAYLGTQSVLEAELGRRLCGLAQVAAANVPVDLLLVLGTGDDDTRTAHNIRKRLELVSGDGVSRVMVVDGQRRVRMDASGELAIGSDAPRLALDQVEMDKARGGQPAASVLFEGRDGRLYKSCYAQVVGGDGLLVVVDGAADLFDTLDSLAGLYSALALVALLVLTLLAYGVARTLTRPLARLSQQVRQVGSGMLDRPITVADDDEVGQVGRALEEMRLALAARDEERQMMLAGIAHEVRNPLGGMELYAGILAETAAELPDDTPPAVREELVNAAGRIRRELTYLSGVVNDFLNFARDTHPQRRAVPLAALLEQVASLCAPEAEKRSIGFRVVAPPPEATAMLDEGQIKSALINVTQNAVQALGAGGTVELYARLAEGRVVLGVKDDGPGMETTQVQRALTPFYTTKEKGTGLGMPLVVKIARAHGGRLEVNTAPGQGCHVMLVLPAGGAS